MIQETLEDFRKRYKGTYLFLSFNGKEHLVRYDSDNEEEFCFYSPQYGDILVDEDTARNNIEIVFPPTGLYNLLGSVYEFNRLPARQWKRAPCKDNTQFKPIFEQLNCSVDQISLHHTIVEKLFFPVYPSSLEQAVKELKLATAISKKFAISYSPEDNSSILFWYKSQPIGYVYPDTKTISIKYKPLLQEVVDFLKKKEYTWSLNQSN